jgi:hypothetical protein
MELIYINSLDKKLICPIQSPSPLIILDEGDVHKICRVVPNFRHTDLHCILIYMPKMDFSMHSTNPFTNRLLFKWDMEHFRQKLSGNPHFQP